MRTVQELRDEAVGLCGECVSAAVALTEACDEIERLRAQIAEAMALLNEARAGWNGAGSLRPSGSFHELCEALAKAVAR